MTTTTTRMTTTADVVAEDCDAAVDLPPPPPTQIPPPSPVSAVVGSRQLEVTASYDAEIGYYGSEVTCRRVRRVFRLPDCVTDVDRVDYDLSPDGHLDIEILLKPERPYKFDVTTEELDLAGGNEYDDEEEDDGICDDDGVFDDEVLVDADPASTTAPVTTLMNGGDTTTFKVNKAEVKRPEADVEIS